MSLDIDAYREYISSSRGEFTVAKDIYVSPRTGWFSDRTVCYLAAGRPVVTQRTGFEKFIPTGAGLLGFDTPDEAVDAIKQINADYPAPCACGARDSRRVFRSGETARRSRGGRGDLNVWCRRHFNQCSDWTRCIATSAHWLKASLVLVGLLGAFAVRRRRRAVTATTFLLLSGSALIDAGSRFIPNETVGQKVAVAAFVLFLFGVIRLVLEFVDAVTRRGKVHFSTITKDLLMLMLWFVVVMVVLYTDFGVQPLSILATTTVFAAVLGFALQETLGNVFSGLSLSMGRPFEPGDWIRSGSHVGQVKGIAWRATTIVTRDGERLEVPNSVIAKDTLYNYSTGAVPTRSPSASATACRPITCAKSCSLSARRPQVLRDPPPEVLAWSYTDFAIQYLIKYWISDYGVQEHVRDRVASSLWYALRRHSIEIPFPTRTVHVRDAGRDEDEKADAQFERELMTDLRQVDWLRGLSDEELKLLVPDSLGAAVWRGRDAGARGRTGRVDVHHAQRKSRSFRPHSRRQGSPHRQLRARRYYR